MFMKLEAVSWSSKELGIRFLSGCSIVGIWLQTGDVFNQAWTK